MYRAKGKGKVREIWDGKVLVGRIRSKLTEYIKMTLTKNSGSIRKVRVTTWNAELPDGTKLDKPAQGTIKAWKEPSAWPSRSS